MADGAAHEIERPDKLAAEGALPAGESAALGDLSAPAAKAAEPPTYKMTVTGRDGNGRVQEIILTPVKLDGA